MVSPLNYTVSAKLFKALMNVDVAEMSKMSAKEIRPILPSLVRMSLISANDTLPTKACAEGRKDILTLLSGIELVNSIVALLSIEFHALEIDVKQEQLLRQKRGSLQTDSILIKANQNLPPSLEFERSDSTSRLRLVLGELLYVSSQIHEQHQHSTEFYIKQSDLFDNAVYIPEICDVLSIAISELPALLTIQQVTEILLHVNYGPNIICCILANFPDCFHEVCKSLISNSDRLEEDNGGSKIRMQTMSMLCKMYPPGSHIVRAQCVELCRMPALTITLTLDYAKNCGDEDSDIVPFVTSLLLHNDIVIRNWFSQFIKSRQKRNRESSQALQALRDELLRHLSGIVDFSHDNKLPMSSVVQASALLRLYCALKGIANFKFQDDETSLIVRLMTSHPPPTPEGVRLVSLSLCMLVACPSLIGHPEQEARAIEWLNWLVKDEAYLESKNGIAASFGELLLLMAIHFHGNQINAISDLVSSTLGMKVTVRTNNLTRMKHIFTQEIFTEQVVTSHAVKVPVTGNLNANISGFLPIHCIYQLLKSRAFIKHKVPIKDWIYRQICASKPPLHPVLPSLVEVFVSSMLVPVNKSGVYNQEHCMVTSQPITEQEIRDVFSKSLQFNGPSLTCQLLLLYYMLQYEDLRLNNISHDNSATKYSTEFLSDIPIKYLLQQAQRDQQNYAGLYSHLLRLLATHFPHLSLVDDWLEEEEPSTRLTKSSVITQQRVVDGIEKMTSVPSVTARMLVDLLKLPATEMWPYAQTVVSSFRSTLDPCVPRYVQELFKQVWLKLNTVLPRCLWVMTINAVRQQKTRVPNVTLTQENIVLDPLQVLRCDGRVFRNASALSILLRVLQACLAASRNKLSRHLMDNLSKSDTGPGHPPQPTDTEREELKNALVTTQESIAVQILLEVCMETEEDRETPGQLWTLREIRSIICTYLHQVFISDPALAKLVHFQGYPRELLSIAVEGIPSMHICTDFIPELLSQPSLDKQVFAIDLISHVSLQYALPKSMSCARLAINTLSTLLGVLPSNSRNELFSKVLPAFVRICEAFPPLVEDSLSLLSQLGRICVSENALAGVPAKINTDGTKNVNTNQTLCEAIETTFAEIIQKSVLKTKIY
uniref:Integrator complex subunit 2 n=1 Tax=Cacopsylla melanoneura TaxID=428564 RepID=A0A8D9APX7_9HEMI